MDDFKFQKQIECPKIPEVPPMTQPAMTTSEPEESWGCNFEDDLCDMTRVDSYPGSWVRDNAVDSVPSTEGKRTTCAFSVFLKCDWSVASN